VGGDQGDAPQLDDIYAALARAYLEPYIKPQLPDRVKILARWRGDYEVDG